jgi:hypothetical protein
VVTRESSIPDYGWLEKVGKEEVSNRFVEMRHPTPFTQPVGVIGVGNGLGGLPGEGLGLGCEFVSQTVGIVAFGNAVVDGFQQAVGPIGAELFSWRVLLGLQGLAVAA